MDAEHYLFETINEVEERIKEYELDLEESDYSPTQIIKIEKDINEYKTLLKKLKTLR